MRASVDLPEPDGPTMASDSPGFELEADAVEDGFARARRQVEQLVDAQPSFRLGQQQPRALLLQAFDGGADAGIGGARLHHVAPAFDHHLERLQRAPGDDRGRDHHAAGDAALDREIGADAEDDDLRDQPREFRGAADPDIAVERLALPLERAALLAAPMQDAFVQHPHGVDHLRVAGEGFGMGVRLRRAQRRLRRAAAASPSGSAAR